MGWSEAVGSDFELVVPCLRDGECEFAEIAGCGLDGREAGSSRGDLGVGDATAGGVVDGAGKGESRIPKSRGDAAQEEDENQGEMGKMLQNSDPPIE